MVHNLTSDLSGKHFFITGGSSGLGRHTAIRLARAGARVHLTGRDESRLQTAVAECESDHAAFTPCDLSNPDSLTDVIKAASSQHGPFDGFFHSAGTELIVPAAILNEKRLMQLFQSSTFALFSIAKAATKKNVVRDGGGVSIVAMSSVAGIRGQTGLSAYSSAKGATDAAVRSLAVELAPRKIRVNSIVAGAVQTEMHSRITANLNQESVDSYAERHPLGFGMPDDISSAVLFLLSDASRWITGTAMIVDGGYSCR